MRLSKHDRAAMQLALECVRADTRTGVIDAVSALESCRVARRSLSLARDVAGALRRSCSLKTGTFGYRLLRARLALLLRTLLRVDGGRFPRVRFVPLWERAPSVA